MNLLDDFSNYYDENIAPLENIYNQKRMYYEKKIKKYGISAFILFILGIIFAFVAQSGILFFICFIIGICVLYISYNEYKKMMSRLKREIIQPAIQKCLGGYLYNPKGSSEWDFKKSGIFKNYDIFSSADSITGNFDNDDDSNFAVSEIKLEEETRDKNGNMSTRTVFKGIFIKANLKKSISTTISIKADIKNKIINTASANFKKLFGINKLIVRLENLEFERFFEVYCDDQISARKLLTVDFMEKIVEIRKKYNVDMYLKFSGNLVYVLLDKINVIDDERLYKRGLNKENLYFNLRTIGEIIRVISLIREG